MATTSKRIIFSFDEKSLQSLEQVKQRGAFPSLGTAVRESVSINEVLHDQAALGFTEIVVRNPKTNQEKTIFVPSVNRRAPSSGSGK